MSCEYCGEAVDQGLSGRKRKYCKRSCRQRAYEERKFKVNELWDYLLDQYDTCYLCAQPLGEYVVFDHMIATVWGGRTDESNVRPVHMECNLKKGAALIRPEDFGQSADCMRLTA